MLRGMIACGYPKHWAQFVRALKSQPLGGISGTTAICWWHDIEPADGHFNFAMIDEAIALSHARGIGIQIAVSAGGNTPEWLFAAGAERLEFRWSSHRGATGKCDTVVVAPPWDDTFLHRFTRMAPLNLGEPQTIQRLGIV